MQLIELEIYAVRRSVSLFGEFHYRVKSPQSNQIINTVCHRPQRRKFALYKSFDVAELSRPKRVIWRKLAIPLALFFVGGFFFYSHVLDAEGRNARLLVDAPVENSQSFTTELTPLELKSLPGKIEVPEYERVFLTIIKAGDRILTVDPDTNRVVDIRSLISEKITKLNCSSDNLNCYYDRPVGSGVVIAGNSFAPQASTSNTSDSYKLPSLNPMHIVEEKPVAGPANFIVGFPIPPPERIIGGVNVEPATEDE